MMKRALPIFLAIAAAVMFAPTAGAADAGSVIFAKGDVSAERAPPVALAKGDSVLDDDTIVTGEASRAQLLMVDGAKIAIRPASRLRIEEYSYTDPSALATITASDDKSVMSLVKGGFRTITGAIASEGPDEYEVRTAVGVLGIRGTDYSAMFCNGDCDWVPGATAAAPVPDGLYLGVSDGRIVFRTSLATIELAAGEYAFIPLDVPEPQRLDEPPPVLLEENELSADKSRDAAGARPADGRDGSQAAGGSTPAGFDAALGTRRAPGASAQGSSAEPAAPDGSEEAPKQPTIATDPDGSPVDITPGTQPDPQGPRTIGYSGGPLGNLDLPQNAVADNEPGRYVLDPSNNLLSFDAAASGRTGTADTVTFDIGSASNLDTGFDSMTVLRWGRWSGGAIEATLASDGSSEQISLANRSLHWISGPEGAPPAMPITGSAEYTLIGSTSPTDDQGNVGILGNASFAADFTSMLVSTTVSLDIAGVNWTAAGDGVIGAQANLPAHLFQGFYNAVIIGGQTGGSGTFSGFFSDPGPTSDPSFPGGAGLTYSLSDPQGANTVSGALAFGNP